MKENELSAIFEGIMLGLEKQDYRLYEGLKKWKPLLVHTVSKIAYITGKSSDDVLQEVLMGVIEVNNIYDIPLYRYNGKLYERLQDDGSRVLLITPRYNKEKVHKIWVSKDDISLVKKGKLNSSIYREINQKCYDIISSFFVQKNGFEKVKVDEAMVKVKSGKDGVKYKKKSISKIVKHIELMSIDDESFNFDIYGVDDNAESYLILKQYFDTVVESISEEAELVLQYMTENPGTGIDKISKSLNLSHSKVKVSMCEIERSIPFLKNDEDDAMSLSPIYLKACHVS